MKQGESPTLRILKTFENVKSDISNLIIKTIYYTLHKNSTTKMKTEKHSNFIQKFELIKAKQWKSCYISLFPKTN